jgi:SAM-dependent methyltransferase
MREHQRAWLSNEMVAKFDNKRAADFFVSERHFLDRIASNVNSVLDIGCASGRFIELLRDYDNRAAFTGIDIAENNILRGRKNYPDGQFHFSDALEIKLAEHYDLVNATGVIQHEPRYTALIDRMLGWSNRYIMFDIKLAAIDDDLVDIERAYGTIGDTKLYYIIFSWRRFAQYLLTLPGIARVSVWGYETPASPNTILPDEVNRLVSAGVLIETGEAEAAPTLECELPSFLTARDEIQYDG